MFEDKLMKQGGEGNERRELEQGQSVERRELEQGQSGKGRF